MKKGLLKFKISRPPGAVVVLRCGYTSHTLSENALFHLKYSSVVLRINQTNYEYSNDNQGKERCTSVMFITLSDDVIHITCEVDSFLFNSGVVLTVHIACLSCWVIYNVAMIRI